MSYIFSKCTFLQPIDLSKFNTSNVTNMFSMFYNIPKKCKIICSDKRLKNLIKDCIIF